MSRNGSRDIVPKGKPQGRPSKLTPERSKAIIDLISHGVPVETAAAASGIDQRTYYNWVAIGKAIVQEFGPDQYEVDGAAIWPETLKQFEVDCGHFFQGCREGTAKSEAAAVLVIKQAMPTHWQAAMTFLERRFPDRWRRPDAIVVTNPLEGPRGIEGTQIDEAAMLNDPEAVRMMHQALALVAQETGLSQGMGQVVSGPDSDQPTPDDHG